MFTQFQLFSFFGNTSFYYFITFTFELRLWNLTWQSLRARIDNGMKQFLIYSNSQIGCGVGSAHNRATYIHLNLPHTKTCKHLWEHELFSRVNFNIKDNDRFLGPRVLEIQFSFSKSSEEKDIYKVVLAQISSKPCPLTLITSALPSASN